MNIENYKKALFAAFLRCFTDNINASWETGIYRNELAEVFRQIEKISDRKSELIIDEVEGTNYGYFGDFLHSIPNACHSRDNHWPYRRPEEEYKRDFYNLKTGRIDTRFSGVIFPEISCKIAF